MTNFDENNYSEHDAVPFEHTTLPSLLTGNLFSLSGVRTLISVNQFTPNDHAASCDTMQIGHINWPKSQSEAGRAVFVTERLKAIPGGETILSLSTPSRDSRYAGRKTNKGTRSQKAVPRHEMCA